MKKLLVFSLILCIHAAAKERHQLRQWTGENGKKVIAKFHSFKNKRIGLSLPNNKKVSVRLSKISNEDKIYLRSITRDSTIKFEHPIVDKNMRKLIPSLNQTAFGSTNDNCGPNSVANFLMWWDQNGIVPLPYKEKDLYKLADKIHKDLERSMRTANGTSFKNMDKGLKKYFLDEKLHEFYNPKLEFLPANLENIHSVPVNETISILSLQTLKNGRLDQGHYVSVISCEENVIEFNTWGYHFTGKLRPGKLQNKDGIFVEVVREPGTKVFHWLTEQGGGFFIEKTDTISKFTVTKRNKPRKVQRGIKAASN